MIPDRLDVNYMYVGCRLAHDACHTNSWHFAVRGDRRQTLTTNNSEVCDCDSFFHRQETICMGRGNFHPYTSSTYLPPADLATRSGGERNSPITTHAVCPLSTVQAMERSQREVTGIWEKLSKICSK